MRALGADSPVVLHTNNVHQYAATWLRALTHAPFEVRAGDVVLFHYHALHGSLPNRSTRVRKTVLAQLHAGTDTVDESVGHPNERASAQRLELCSEAREYGGVVFVDARHHRRWRPREGRSTPRGTESPFRGAFKACRL